MMLSDEEIKEIRNRAKLNDNRQIEPMAYARSIELAVLAKASRKVQGDVDSAFKEYAGDFGGIDYLTFSAGYEAGIKAMQAPKQEPVHWRAVLSDGDREKNPVVSSHVVGFSQLSAAEAWVASERDFWGLSYTIEPLYLHHAPPQPAAIPESTAPKPGGE